MTAYDALDDEAQRALLRPVAEAGAAAFGLGIERLEIVAHEFNTTFALDTPEGRRVALRVNTNSVSTVPMINAQCAWLLAIAQGTPVRVPVPLRTTAGEWWAEVESPDTGQGFRVVVSTWLDGEDPEHGNPAIAHAIGRAMALLHEQARTWRPPAGGALAAFDEPLFGDPDKISSHFQGEGGAVIAEALRRTRSHFNQIVAAGPVHPIHGDLHLGNIKWHDGQLAVFDFDDCGLSTPLVDLGIATFYLRREAAELEPALRAGYASVRPLPEGPPEWLESVLAARQLLLANSLLSSTTATLQAMSSDYLDLTLRRLRPWLDTGRFQPLAP